MSRICGAGRRAVEGAAERWQGRGMHMRLVVAYLWFGSWIYLAIGVAGMVAPAWLMGFVGIELEGASALNEIRAAYGGQLLGLAVVMGLGALRAERRRWALGLFVLAVGGMVLARAVSVVVDGAPNGVAWGLGALELSGAVSGAALLGTWPRRG